MRKRALAALLLVLALLLCGAAPLPDGYESVPMEIDGLLFARAFRRGGETFVPLRALCAACGQELAWSEDGTRLTLQIGPLGVQGEKGRQYLMADGRFVWAPGGWLIRGEELYLPVPAAEKLFGVEAGTDGDSCAFRTKGAALLQGGEEFYALNFPADDLYWLTQIIHAEAGVEPMEGKIGVGNVVMNRVKSEIFPDTVFEVVYDTEHVIQFEPVAVGAIHEEPDEESIAAARLVLEGANTVGDCLYFVNPSAGSAWFDNTLKLVKTIGRHNFYTVKDE
ncbi:MAG: cell wall hydrolase [Oscillospiraceae bacterium]|nr:cell wall hydrolase [Oscillospiraceae bacterium]